ncbi:hypothetical protein RLOC_00004682 [Lonchura striata]|uniref:Uncharacterized protein n=1 Tax=Lonchura striata TaxID=40157 RepID=A0A218U7G4_9PASE|nr:hypothetical protein RLOC_00004682 [Lonchura striata domestica]
MARVCAQQPLALGWDHECSKSLYRSLDPRPKLSPPQTCAALMDPREPYKLTSGTWTGEFYFPGKRARVCTQGPLSLGWGLTSENPYFEGCTRDQFYPHLKLVLP